MVRSVRNKLVPDFRWRIVRLRLRIGRGEVTDMKHPVDRDAVRRAAARHTKASAAINGRVVPKGFVRSQRVEKFLAEQFKQRS